jgi:hypothetical protein
LTEASAVICCALRDAPAVLVLAGLNVDVDVGARDLLATDEVLLRK